MIHPDMVANLPGIELESDFPRPEVPSSGENPDTMTQLEAAILNSGVYDEAEANTYPRGVIDDAQIVVREEGDNYNDVPSACTPCNRIFYHNKYILDTK